MTRKKQHIGSHSRHSRPDEKMGRLGSWTSAQRQTVKRLMNRKRRQRDKGD